MARAGAATGALALALAWPPCALEAALAAKAPATPTASGSASCRGPAAIADFGSDGRIGAKWNAATRTIAFGRPQKDGTTTPSSPTPTAPTSGVSPSLHGATTATSFPPRGIPPAS